MNYEAFLKKIFSNFKNESIIINPEILIISSIINEFETKKCENKSSFELKMFKVVVRYFESWGAGDDFNPNTRIKINKTPKMYQTFFPITG